MQYQIPPMVSEVVARVLMAVRDCCATRRRTIVLGGLLACIAIGSAGWLWVRWSRTPLPHRAVPAPNVPAAVSMKPRWIDGTLVPADAEQPYAFAVVLDNAPEARPQSGIGSAPLVFEVPVEGQRTRLLAVYPVPADVARAATEAHAATEYLGASAQAAGAQRDPIGPVRSARPYAVGVADALGVPLAHVGGSPAALAMLAERAHVDEYYRSPFWRSLERLAPFNAYTSPQGLLAFFVRSAAMGVPRDDAWRLWVIEDTARVETAHGAAIRIPFGPESAFTVEWRYDGATGTYTRFQGGRVHRDIAGDAVHAKNVVLLEVTSQVLDRIGRITIPQIEPGPPFATPLPARVLRGGARVDGTWHWDDPMGAVGLFGLVGGEPAAPIALLPGTTWVEVVNFSLPDGGSTE